MLPVFIWLGYNFAQSSALSCILGPFGLQCGGGRGQATSWGQPRDLGLTSMESGEGCQNCVLILHVVRLDTPSSNFPAQRDLGSGHGGT